MPLPFAIANCFISPKQKDAMGLRYSYLYGSSSSVSVRKELKEKEGAAEEEFTEEGKCH